MRYQIGTGLTDLIHTNAAVTSATDSRSVDMSADGRFVAFVANTNGAAGADSCILLWDAQSGTTTLASGDLSNSVPSGSTCDWPTLTPDGRFIAFLSSAATLVTNLLIGLEHLYVRDLQSGLTSLADADTNGVGSLLSSMPAPCLSDDGRYIAFECPDGNLVAQDNNRSYDVFVRDLNLGATELISARAPALPCVSPNGLSVLSSLCSSADGRYMAFASDAENLVENDTNGCRNVFVRDLMTGSNVLVSVASDGLTPGDNYSAEPSLSSDGRYVAFGSQADNLVPGDTNKAEDVFVRDLQVGSTRLVSVNTGGGGPGNADSYSPIISTNGRYVLFRSLAANLASGSFSSENLFLRDLQAGSTYALTSTGVVPPPGAAMTPDGRFTAYAAGVYVYVWDAQALSRVYTNNVSGASGVAISPDGQRVLYWTSSGLYAVNRATRTNWLITSSRQASKPGLRFSSDGRFLAYAAAAGSIVTVVTNQIYLYDFQTGTNLLVSRSYVSLGPADASSDSPAISPDGRFIAYRSYATDIAAGDQSSLPNILLFDSEAAVTTVVSASRLGAYTGDNRSLSPFFTGNGQNLLFESWASDLAAGDFNSSGDIFSFGVYSGSLASSLIVQLFSNAQGTWITWPAVTGANYAVQYKNSLSDPVWQNLNGVMTILGNSGYLNDPAPAPAQRFYRVVSY